MSRKPETNKKSTNIEGGSRIYEENTQTAYTGRNCFGISFSFRDYFLQQFYQKSIYEENSQHLLSTYEQVDKTFTMFVQHNWNALSDWSNNLQYLDDAENMKLSGMTLPDAKMPGNIRIFICLMRTVIL